LVQKSYARLFYNDFVYNAEDPCFKNVQQFKGMNTEESLQSKELEKAFVEVSKPSYTNKVLPNLLAATKIGNMYCASLYACLATLLSTVTPEELVGKRVGMFSYGSGLASSFFSFKIVKPITQIYKILDIKNRLDSRVKTSPEKFDEVMRLREESHNKNDFNVVGDGSSVEEAFFEGTYYLEKIDAKWRRFYKRRI
ncbi:14177_t:CDS:2, partial [Dentiscutata heterogama]